MLTINERIRAEECRRSFFDFFCEFWETIEPNALVLNWHIKFLCDFLQEIVERWEKQIIQDDVLINIAPSLSKSTIIQLLSDWITLRNPAVKILGTGYSSLISRKNATKVKACFTSTKFQKYYPNKVVLDRNNRGKTQFGNMKMGIYYTTSTTGTATGLHADFILNDDPLNAKEANSEVKRDGVIEFMDEVLSSRKTQDWTVTITIQQRLHVADPSAHLLAKKSLQHICLPVYVDAHNRHLVQPQSALAHYDENNGYLNPVRFGQAKIESYRKDLGAFAFAAQILQNPADDSTGIFKKEYFEIVTYQEFLQLTAGTQIIWEFDADTALTTDRANDPTALLASCTIDGVTYIRESYADWLGYEALLEYIPQFLERNDYTFSSELYIEPKANGKSLVDSIEHRNKILVKEAPAPVKDKEQRAHDILPYVCLKKVKLIDGRWIVDFLKEVTTFPNAAHDDRVDTLTQCIARIAGVYGKKKKERIIL